ncbi:hypothetical protein O181_022475 [Austropuccinia psidii MF-1]|uniref:BED-type domain-containing protein n=1 Tax=Austropuccinia psidii MF-1 TaxID=1389203 RepID=A0A9Q3CHG0_9BASI|nr:hypothetical protein [Austropuccinia psidii MF-1]
MSWAQRQRETSQLICHNSIYFCFGFISSKCENLIIYLLVRFGKSEKLTLVPLEGNQCLTLQPVWALGARGLGETVHGTSINTAPARLPAAGRIPVSLLRVFAVNSSCSYSHHPTVERTYSSPNPGIGRQPFGFSTGLATVLSSAEPPRGMASISIPVVVNSPTPHLQPTEHRVIPVLARKSEDEDGLIPVLPSKADSHDGFIPVPGNSTASYHDIKPNVKKETGNVIVKKRGKSDVWDTFQNLKGEGRAICTRCNKVMSYHPNSGTSALRRHLKAACGRHFSNPDRPRTDGSSNPPSSYRPRLSPPQTAHYRFNQETSQDDLIRLALAHNSVLNLIDEPRFLSFLRRLQPQFKALDQVKLQEKCMSEFGRMKAKLKQFIANESFRVSFTSDYWISKQGHSYIFIVAHWINSDWGLERRLLCFKPVPPLLSSEDLAGLISDVLADWSLQDRITSFTMDNTSSGCSLSSQISNLFAHNELVALIGKDLLPTRIGASFLKVAIEDGLLSAMSLLDKLRCTVRNLRSSSVVQQTFNKTIQDMNLVTNFQQPVLDITGSWDSIYTMLESTVPFQTAFIAMQVNNPDVPNISFEEWQELQNICKFLKGLREALASAFSSKSLTSNTAFQNLWKVYTYLEQEASNPNNLICEISRQIYSHFEKYWEKLSITLGILAILDPRLKIHFIKFCFARGSSPDFIGLTKVVFVMEQKLQELFEQHYRTERQGLNSEFKTKPLDLEPFEAEEMLAFERSLVASMEEKYDSDLSRYLAQEPELGQSRDSSFDVLHWWKTHAHIYPDLAKMARDVLSIQLSSIVSEETCNAACEVIDNPRCELSQELLEGFMLSQDWLKRD